jgi:hypothetical protein
MSHDNEAGRSSHRAAEGYTGDARLAPGTPTIKQGRQVRGSPLPGAKQYRLICERPNKGNKAIEREILASFQGAQSLDFRGDFRAWEHLLRIHE